MIPFAPKFMRPSTVAGVSGGTPPPSSDFGNASRDFSGNDQFVGILNSVSGGHDFAGWYEGTIAAWVKADTVADLSPPQSYIAGRTIFELRTEIAYTDAASAWAFNFGIKSGRTFVGVAKGPANIAANTGYKQAATVLTTGVWYHLAVTISGIDFTLYVDGVDDGSSGAKAAPDVDRSVGSTTANMAIGCRSRDGGETDDEEWDGLIADVRIYSTVLNATDIADLASGVNVTSGLIGHWIGNDDNLLDLSGNGNHGINSASPTTYSTDGPLD